MRTAGDVKFSQTSVGCVQWRYFAGRAADVKSTLPPLKEPSPDKDWPVVASVVANDQHARTGAALACYVYATGQLGSSLMSPVDGVNPAALHARHSR